VRRARNELSTVASDGYEARIGRYAGELADALIGVSGIEPGGRVLDVGCGSGALTARLAEIVGPENVAGIDPSADALAECRSRIPGVELHEARAEELPFADASFDAVLAQLVIGLMGDARAGATEMRRVARLGAPVSTCVWDFGAGMTVLRAFWDAARAIDPRAAHHDQARTRPYSTRAELEALWSEAGMSEVSAGELVVGAEYRDFDDLWEPMTIPDGGPGVFYKTLLRGQRKQLREALWDRLDRPAGPFRLEARAWYAVGRA
jgi:ubiquinone/menaquinone biosynthesis C-methylase UbiE